MVGAEPVGATAVSQPRAVNATLLTYVCLLLLALVPLVAMVRPLLLSVATGGLFAVLSYPLFARARRHLSQWAAALMVTLGVATLVLAPLSLLVVGALREGSGALTELSTIDTPTIDELVNSLHRWIPYTDPFVSHDEVRAMLREGAGSLSTVASGLLFATVQSIPNTLVHFALILLSTFFLLVDGRRLLKWVAGKLPLSRGIRLLLVASAKGAANAVIVASAGAAAAQAFLMFVGFWLLGVPSALLGAGVAFVLAWIPPLGPMPVWGCAAGYLYVQGHPGKAVIMVALGLLIGVTDNVVRPLILRGRESMHPLVSLVSILGGLALMGVPGVFLGPLLTATAISLLEIWPAVASYSGIPVSDSGDTVPEVPRLRGAE